MGGKKKKGGKKQPEEEEEDTPHKGLNVEILRAVKPLREDQQMSAQAQRNYVQLERDTMQTFFDITKKEVKQMEMAIAAKDREMELMEDNHRVEVRVYMQKVKHLEYEHRNNLKNINAEGLDLLNNEHNAHDEREKALKDGKKSLKMELMERELHNAEEVRQLKLQHDKNLQKMREGFENNLEELRKRCTTRLSQLEDDLELRRKVDIHEIEERKNLHINDLMKNHEKAFGQMKNYYNDITNDNLKLIKSLKDDVAEMKKKAVANQKLMYDISQENKRLSEPLAIAVHKVAELRSQLKGREKDRLSLRNAKARLGVLEEDLGTLAEDYTKMETDYMSVEKERDELYSSFETAVKAVQQKSDFRNLLLEQKLGGMEENIKKTHVQIGEIISATKLDPGEISRIMQSLDDMLLARNAMITDLRYMVARATKGYNDSLRTYDSKLSEMGIPKEEVENMGFMSIQTSASVLPAGLVAK